MLLIDYPDGHFAEHSCSEEISKIPVNPNGMIGKLVAKTSISLIDVIGAWVPSTVPGLERCHLFNGIKLNCGGNQHFPYVALFNISGINRGAFSSTNLSDDTEISFKVNQEKATYDVTYTVALSKNTKPFEIIIDRREKNWQEILSDWRNSLLPEKFTYPEAAYDPVYCTWYATHAAITQDLVEKYAADAQNLGFTTLIVDDGWCYDEMKRVTPETAPKWYEPVGDWKLSTRKFPYFQAHVERIKSQGMKYMLWVAPHLWGHKSKRYQQHPEMTVKAPVDNRGNMNDLVADHQPLIADIAALVKDYKLDGLKIDFIDTIPPDVDAPHCDATLSFLKNLTDALKAENKDILLEFRQSYSTLATLPFGTQFRAFDTPFDWFCNFGRLAELRLTIGSLAPVHADPAYWAEGELPANVARHMMAMLAGVPMLSMDTARLTDEEKRIIRYYINFYNDHRDVINHGSWKFLFTNSDVAAGIAENENERLIILADHARLADIQVNDGKMVWVMNLSSKNIHIQCTNAVDDSAMPSADNLIPAAGSALIK